MAVDPGSPTSSHRSRQKLDCHHILPGSQNRPIAAVQAERYRGAMSAETRYRRLVNEAVEQSFSGWDFSFVAGRLHELETSWDYRQLVERRLPRATALADLCTGGGEFLDAFCQLPDVTYATEGFAPNIGIAKRRLEPRGVKVVAAPTDDKLPLPSTTFDLVINRHGAFSADELARISTPGAVFLTQQVGSDNANGINQVLHAPATTPSDWHLETAVDQLISRGFSISQSIEAFPLMSFRDIGALVFYLNAIPWQVPDFDVSKYDTELRALHEQIEAEGSFEVRAHRFLVEANLG